MSRSREYVTAYLDADPQERAEPALPAADTPFRILLLGDFSGRTNRAAPADPGARTRKAISVDLDNLDDVMHRLAVRIVLPGPDAPIALRFESLEDFHPDSLYQNVPLFQQLRRLRQELLEERATPRRTAPPAADPLPSALGSGSLLDDIVGGAQAPTGARRQPDAWQQTIRDIVTPHLEAQPDVHQAELAGRVTETANLAMRMLLHHPDFQELEAAWRSVDFLLRRLDVGAELQISLIDIARDELLADPAALEGMISTAVGETPWAVVAGLYTFDPDVAEIGALGRIARIAQAAGTPFLASAGPRLLGCESFGEQPDPDDWTLPLDAGAEEAWDKLRRLPEARWIGLALPRWLLREPYGKDSVDLPQFAETSVPPDHADFLWGNPAVACVYLIGESFLRDGWELPLHATEITGLPVHTYKLDGETTMTPCAECWMGERTAERFLSRGLMPLASIKGRDAVRLIRLQSIGLPVSGLRARWNCS